MMHSSIKGDQKDSNLIGLIFKSTFHKKSTFFPHPNIQSNQTQLLMIKKKKMQTVML